MLEQTKTPKERVEAVIYSFWCALNPECNSSSEFSVMLTELKENGPENFLVVYQLKLVFKIIFETDINQTRLLPVGQDVFCESLEMMISNLTLFEEPKKIVNNVLSFF